MMWLNKIKMNLFYGKLLNNDVAEQNKDESFFMVNC
jgi:hypothetical protein